MSNKVYNLDSFILFVLLLVVIIVATQCAPVPEYGSDTNLGFTPARYADPLYNVVCYKWSSQMACVVVE